MNFQYRRKYGVLWTRESFHLNVRRPWVFAYDDPAKYREHSSIYAPMAVASSTIIRDIFPRVKRHEMKKKENTKRLENDHERSSHAINLSLDLQKSLNKRHFLSSSGSVRPFCPEAGTWWASKRF